MAMAGQKKAHQRTNGKSATRIGRVGHSSMMAPVALAAIYGLMAYAAMPLDAWAQTAQIAQPASSDAVRHYQIETGPLAPALRNLASSANVLLTFTEDLVADKRTAGLNGQYTTTAALAVLLSGTGLQAVQLSNGGYVLQRLPAGAGDAAMLSAVTVEGGIGRERADGPVVGYVPKRSATGTKTDTSLHETPQSISVVPRQQMDDQAADSLEQAFEYTAGISSLEGGALRSIGTRFVVRGFSTLGTAALYLNGTKFPLNSLSGSMELYNFERVELLKGPASILYGQAAPGGLVNLVSKRPTAEPLREIEVQLGSWKRKQLAVDLGGPVTEDGKVRYRLTALHRDSDSMIKQISRDRTSLSGSLEWQLTDDTLLTVLATYDKINSPYDGGKPLQGTLLPNPYGQISRTLFVGEPGFDRFDVRGATLGYLLEHRFNEDWKFRQNLLAYDYKSDNDYAAVSANVRPMTPDLADRFTVSRNDTDKGFAVDNQLHGKLRHGRFEHNVLFGLDYSKNDWTRDQRIGSIAALNLFDPVYGATPVIGPVNAMSTGFRQFGVYVQDQIKFDQRWIVLLGGRYDTVREYNGSEPKEKSDAFSPRAGLMYLFDNGLAPYYSFTQSFQPVAGSDFNLNRFKPSTGTQHEVGIKYEPPGVDAAVTLAAYQITQRNVLTSDPVHAGFLQQSGKVRSRGVELEGRASLGRQWDVVAALGWTDAKVLESNHVAVGSRPTAVPRMTASLWADYAVLSVPGLSAGLGVRHVGQQEINAIAVPSYTVYDAALRYERAGWRFALNVKNLADKTYLASCPGVCYFGEERNFTLTARYSW